MPKRNLSDVSYALVGTVLAIVGFLIGGLVAYNGIRLAIAAPSVGAIIGFLASAWALRRNGLPLSATVGDMGAALRRAKAGRAP